MRGKPAFIKSAKALSYSDAFLMQCPKIDEPFKSDVYVDMTIYYASRRPDLDETLVLDLMQKAGIYINDRQVKGRTTLWGLDPENPRVEISVRDYEVPVDLIRKRA